MSILNWQVNSSSNFVSFFIVMTQNSPVNFKLINFLLWIKGSHQTSNFETFKCSGENFPNSLCHFWKQKSVFLQILHHSLVPWKITTLYFFRSNIAYFSCKEPIKVQIFETFECSDKNSPNSCQFWNNKSVFLQIFHQSLVSWDTTPLYFFSWNFIYFQQKEPIKVQILWNFSNRKSEIVHFDGFLLSKSYKVSAKKIQNSYL